MMIAIHQPNFFPWLPFFSKMRAVDKFVIMSHCQFEKNNYQNRFFYRDTWHTMSVRKGLDPIIEKKYVDPFGDWDRIKRKLSDKSKILSRFDSCISESLAETNTKLITSIAECLSIQTVIVNDDPTNQKSSERLVWICKSFGADRYLAGSGGKSYMDLDMFEKAGIEVVFQEVEAKDRVHVLDIL